MLGWAKERIGRTVNKVIILRFVGMIDQPVTKTKIVKGKIVHYRQIVKVPRYRAVARHYFTNKDTDWRAKKLGKAYELYATDETFSINETHFQFLDYETGNTLNIGAGQIGARENPVKLDEKIETDSIKTFVQQNKTTIAWAFLAIGILVGIFIGFSIGQNSDAIMAGINQAKNGIIPNPTPYMGVP